MPPQMKLNVVPQEEPVEIKSEEKVLRQLPEGYEYIPGGNGAYPIAQASSSSFTFFSDIDADGAFEQVRYFASGTTLFKGVINPTGADPISYPPTGEIVTEVVHNIINATNIFAYYPEGYAPETGALTVPINVSFIRMLKITGTTDRDQTRPPAPSTLSIIVTIRNLRGEI